MEYIFTVKESERVLDTFSASAAEAPFIAKLYGIPWSSNVSGLSVIREGIYAGYSAEQGQEGVASVQNQSKEQITAEYFKRKFGKL